MILFLAGFMTCIFIEAMLGYMALCERVMELEEEEAEREEEFLNG